MALENDKVYIRTSFQSGKDDSQIFVGISQYRIEDKENWKETNPYPVYPFLQPAQVINFQTSGIPVTGLIPDLLVQKHFKEKGIELSISGRDEEISQAKAVIKSLVDREKLDSKQVPYFLSIFDETGIEGDIIRKGDELVKKGKGKATIPVIKPQPEIIE
jgi:hypothetical protein